MGERWPQRHLLNVCGMNTCLHGRCLLTAGRSSPATLPALTLCQASCWALETTAVLTLWELPGVLGSVCPVPAPAVGFQTLLFPYLQDTLNSVCLAASPMGWIICESWKPLAGAVGPPGAPGIQVSWPGLPGLAGGD